jgi:hypothetical protein
MEVTPGIAGTDTSFITFATDSVLAGIISWVTSDNS